MGIAETLGSLGKGAIRAITGGPRQVPKLGKPSPGMKWEYQPGLISRMLNSGWQLQALRDFGNSFLPSAAVIVEVDVFGSPKSNKQSLYFLALSIAFGVIDYQLIDLCDSTIQVMIDHTGKHIRVQYTQSYSGLAGNADTLRFPKSGSALIRNPPKSSILSTGKWPNPLSASTESERNQDNGKLVPNGTLLITEGKSPTYQPYLNNGSTETDFINLMCAAILGSACSNPNENTLAEQMQNNTAVAPVIK